MPCLNEAETLETCIRKAFTWIAASGIQGEVIIADNGSTDGSAEIARRCGARVERVPKRGYGAALIAGCKAAAGKYIIMGDADDSYNFLDLDAFVARLRDGYDLVMGNRFSGGIMPGAMKPLHRYFGNPFLSLVGRAFFGSPIRDFHCGLRAFSSDAFHRMQLQTTGMEFASEMVVSATLRKMRVTEVPCVLYPDGRSRAPHLRSFRDGWRHLRFLLMFSPRWLFLYPGLTLSALGLALLIALTPGGQVLLGFGLDIHTMAWAACFVALGFQMVLFATLTRVIGLRAGFLPPHSAGTFWRRRFSLEMGLAIGAVMMLGGMICGLLAVYGWQTSPNQEIGQALLRYTMRLVIYSTMLVTLGAETVLFSFVFSIIDLVANRIGAAGSQHE
ncbi:MAG TPA: glycosyltransferase family 2 protein [Thermoflexales bacterium]|nr:glycosyltransferase family 2 protein [Thermoflexales bacterium]